MNPGIFSELGEPRREATDSERSRFARGRQIALTRFSDEQGLGPLFSAVSCLACHEKPRLGGSASRYRNTAVQILAESRRTLPFEPQYSVADGRNGSSGVPTATRSPQPLFGLGLLGEIPNDEILRGLDVLDEDGDGISGRVNFERGFIGRFGRKAQMATLSGFVRLALLDHMGITTPAVSSAAGQVAGPLELATTDRDATDDPELSPQDTEDLIAFVTLLGAPTPDPPTPVTRAGAALFAEIGCDGCHFSRLDGPRGPLPAYTDLLLHDMGAELADGITLNRASEREYRTQPLWGIAPVGPYLHDGRADTLDSAIRWHGGEAERSRDRYQDLSDVARLQILEFLRSLGGRQYRPQGLLDPEPDRSADPPLDRADQQRFDVGRELFDHDFTPVEGLGPRFNGDGCRSCHFTGGTGGSGPADVDVVREAFPGNPILHRHTIAGSRPLPQHGMGFLRRQTPPLFGLGLVDRITDDEISRRADPSDLNQDGIRGRLSRLPGGRVGRFGWKANVPSLLDFSRDAFSAEMGLTVPPDMTSRFGRSADDDEADDPEVSGEELEALAFFLASLPAPSAANDPDGLALFERTGCADCHVPSMPTIDGVPVRLFSDLLLHDVSSNSAEGELFRTPPLWGLGSTAPFMHDGGAWTVEVSIALHEGESRRSRLAFEALSALERARLLAFVRSR